MKYGFYLFFIVATIQLGAGSAILAQCQNDECFWNAYSTCYQCLPTSGFWCSTRGKCPKQCTGGVCTTAPSAVTAMAEPDGTVNSVERAPGLKPMTDECLAQAAEKRNATVKVSQGSVASSAAWQKNSPAALIEWTTAVDKENRLVLKRAVLENLGESPVTGYQIGWMRLFRDQARKPELHVGDPAKIDHLDFKGVLEIGEPQPASSETEDEKVVEQKDFAYENSGNWVVPPIAFTSDESAIVFFLASVKRDGMPDFHEDLNEVAAQEKARFQSLTQSAPSN